MTGSATGLPPPGRAAALGSVREVRQRIADVPLADDTGRGLARGGRARRGRLRARGRLGRVVSTESRAQIFARNEVQCDRRRAQRTWVVTRSLSTDPKRS